MTLPGPRCKCRIGAPVRRRGVLLAVWTDARRAAVAPGCEQRWVGDPRGSTGGEPNASATQSTDTRAPQARGPICRPCAVRCTDEPESASLAFDEDGDHRHVLPSNICVRDRQGSPACSALLGGSAVWEFVATAFCEKVSVSTIIKSNSIAARYGVLGACGGRAILATGELAMSCWRPWEAEASGCNLVAWTREQEAGGGSWPRERWQRRDSACRRVSKGGEGHWHRGRWTLISMDVGT